MNPSFLDRPHHPSVAPKNVIPLASIPWIHSSSAAFLLSLPLDSHTLAHILWGRCRIHQLLLAAVKKFRR
jgi:hypothetical protein